jgi:hypothetical protein
MLKDTRFSFRVSSELKEVIEEIAANEGRSVAQICDAFLKIGLEGYKREGNQVLQRSLAQSRRRSKQKSQ